MCSNSIIKIEKVGFVGTKRERFGNPVSITPFEVLTFRSGTFWTKQQKRSFSCITEIKKFRFLLYFRERVHGLILNHTYPDLIKSHMILVWWFGFDVGTTPSTRIGH